MATAAVVVGLLSAPRCHHGPLLLPHAGGHDAERVALRLGGGGGGRGTPGHTEVVEDEDDQEDQEEVVERGPIVSLMALDRHIIAYIFLV